MLLSLEWDLASPQVLNLSALTKRSFTVQFFYFKLVNAELFSPVEQLLVQQTLFKILLRTAQFQETLKKLNQS